MDRFRLTGAVSAFGVLFTLPLACDGSTFSSGAGGGGTGGSKSGSAR